LSLSRARSIQSTVPSPFPFIIFLEEPFNSYFHLIDGSSGRYEWDGSTVLTHVGKTLDGRNAAGVYV
jgi:hypothetical protein